MSKNFLAKIIVSFLIFSLATCASKNKNDPSQKNQQQNPVSNEMMQNSQNMKEQNFETIPDEKQAEAIDKKTQEEIEEVEVKDRVFFGYDSYELSAEARQILDVQSEWLKSDDSIKIIVEGHCDEKGTREYNIALGERRANSIKKYLMSKGISSNRIKTVSYGKERPAFFGSDSATLAKNRRAVTVPQN